MAKKKTYYDPQDGKQYYHGEKLGAVNWAAPESDKDESYINQYNYTPSYNAYRQYLEELRRQEEEQRRMQQAQQDAMPHYANPYEEPAKPSYQYKDYDKAMQQAEFIALNNPQVSDKIRQGIANLPGNYSDLPAEQKYNMYADDFEKTMNPDYYKWKKEMEGKTEPSRQEEERKKIRTDSYTNFTSDLKDTAKELAHDLFSDEQIPLSNIRTKYGSLFSKDEEPTTHTKEEREAFAKLDDNAKYEAYINDLEKKALNNGTLTQGERNDVTNYMYSKLTPAERFAINKVMDAERKSYENYDKYEREGSQGVLRGLFINGDFNTDYVEEENAARELLRKQGWSNEKIDRELARYKEYEDYLLTEEKKQEMAIDPNSSMGAKIGMSAYNTLYGVSTAPYRGAEALLSEKGAYGKNLSSRYGLSVNRSEAGYNQVRENAITNEHPVGQAAYNIGVSAAESAYTMAWMQGIGALAGVGGAATAAKEAAKAGEVVTKGMKTAAAVDKAIEMGTLVPFSLNAFDSGYRDAVERGFSEKQAIGYGAATGAIEALTEVFSLDKYWDMASAKKVGRNLFANAMIQAGIEGSEEVASELGSRFADYVSVKVGETGKTQREMDIEEYMAQHPEASFEDASNASAVKFAEDVGMSFISGVGSALPNTAFMSSIGAYRSKYGRDINKAISDRYQSLEVEGNTEYEQKLKQDKERYQNNPTQFVVDNYKAVTDEQQRIKQGLQEIADKEREGKKLSVSDKAFIADNAQIDQNFVDTLYDQGDESDIPYEYRTVRNDVTEDEARRRLGEAAGQGDTEAFLDAMNQLNNAKDDDLRSRASEIIDEYVGMAQSHGITQQAIGQAQRTRAEAYRLGRQGQDVENLSPENQIAYNQGKQEYIENRTKTVISSRESLDNATIGTKEGNMVKLAGTFADDGTINTSDGQGVKVENLDFTKESAITKAYVAADNYKNIDSKNEFMRGIKENTNIDDYTADYKKDYDLGMAGVSVESMKQGFSRLDDEQRMIAYNAGLRDAKIRANNELNKAWGVNNAQGLAFNDAGIKDQGALTFADKLAAQAGFDFHIVSAESEKTGRRNARGAYKSSENAIYIRADRLMAVYHEMSEFAEKYNKKEYDDLKKAIADLSAKRFGAQRYQSMLKEYQTLYGMAGQDSSADEMSGEMFNDSISAMFSTKESAQLLADYLSGNYDPKQAKTLGQKAAGIAKKLANTIRKLASSDNLSGNETEYSKAVYEIADDLSLRAEDFIKMLDTAIQNSKKAQGKTQSTESGQNYALEIQKTEKKLGKQIDNWLQGNMPKDGYFEFGDTPTVLKSLGVADLPVIMEQDSMLKFTSDYKGHNISLDDIKHLPSEMADPILVLEGSKPNSYVELTEIEDKNGNPVVVAIHLNKYHKRLKVNRIASVYGKDNIQGYFNGKEGLVRYADKKRSLSWITNRGLQLPKLVQSINSLPDFNIPQDERKSNYNYSLEEVQEINNATEEMAVHFDAQDEMVYPVDYSLETWNASEYQTDRKNAAKELSKALGITQKKALQYIDDINSIAKIIADDRVRLDYESDEGSAVVSNSDYGASVDFSTICKKRLLYTGTLQQIQKQIGNRVITVDDYLEIRQAMLRDNLETTCGCCYVEGSRAKLGGFMKEFIRKYAATKPEYVPNMYDVTMPDGIRQLRAKHPEVYSARQYFLNHYGRINENDKALFASQQKPKDYTERKAYKGEILKMFKNKKDKVAEKNINGGFRLQSFSDFEVVNLLDLMQVITDMSRCGLAGQAYTKVKNFADALGNTGLKINLSIMAKGVDKNGNLILDEINGMKRADAEYLRNKYSKNVGTIIVCFTDDQIKAAMKDNFIDFIIPFHRSQWQQSQYEALGLPEGTRDYTNFQEDGVINEKGRRVRADHSFMSKEYWDFSKSGRENAEKYIDMCNKANKVPVFDFLLEKDNKGKYYLPEGADGYFKLLIDFKMYDNDGVGSPQMPVKPNFSLDECRQMLMDYEGGHETFPVDQKIADEFTKKIKKREKEFKFSLEMDSEGNNLTEGQMEYFKDSKIRDDQGRLKVMYHGSPNKFTIFDPKKLGGKNGTAEGYGIYFADTQEVTQAYGDEQMKGYLNVTKPASSFAKTISSKDLSKLIKASAMEEAERMVADDEYDSVDEAIKDSWVSNYVNTYEMPMDAVYKKVADDILKLNGNDMDIIREVMVGQGIRDYAQAYRFYDILTDTLGIDGFETEWTGSNGEKSGIVVTFNSNQFKNIDNENPTENEDVRFSLENDSEGNSLTEDQRRYFEHSQIRDDNGNLKVMYHGSNAGGFTIFDPKKSDDKISLFFSDSPNVADSYVNRYGMERPNTSVIYKSDQEKITDAETAKQFLESLGFTDITSYQEGKYTRWSYTDPNYGSRVRGVTQKDFIAEANSMRKGRKGLYKVYLDIQNPLVVDAGNKIDGVVDDVVIAKQKGDFGHIIAFTFNTPLGTETIKKNKSEMDSYIEETFGKDADRVKKAVDDLIADGEYYKGKHVKNVYVDTVVPSNWNNIKFEGGKANTRYIAGVAHERGYDGVYFKNITDNGPGFGGYENGASNIAVAFSSDQVKAVDNEHPTTDPDIRYSIEVDSDDRKLTEGQQRYFNETKVVDDEGRLKVMYHGARGAGFTVFNNRYSDDKRSFFFTDNPVVAESYSGTKESFHPDEPMSYEELSDFAELVSNGDVFVKKDGNDIIVMEYVLPGDPASEVYRGDLNGAKEYIVDFNTEYNFSSDSANYEVYLNLQNPFIFEANGATWDELADGSAWDQHFGDVQINKTDAGYDVEWMGQDFEWYHDTFKSMEDVEKKFGKIYEPFMADEIFISDIYLDKDGNRIPTNTRMISQMAQEQGYDGVIFKDMVDMGMYASRPVSSTIAIAFNPEQIKSVYNINPTSSEDIRYALDLEEEWFNVDEYFANAPKDEAQAVEILKEGMEAMKNEAVDVPKLRTLALKLRNEFGSSYNTNELTSRLEKAFAYMQTEDHVDYRTMMGILKDIARPVIEASGEKVGEEEYKRFINSMKGYKIKLTGKQKAEVINSLGSYGNFCKAMMPITISDKGTTTLDQLWDEMVDASGYVLDRDTTEGDMPLALLDALTAMRPTMRNDYGGDIEDVSRDLAMRIVEEYVGGQASKKMQKEISEIRSRLKKEYSERMKNAQGKANAEIRARNKQRAEQAKEREMVRNLRHQIKMDANKLFRWVEKPVEGKSIPHNMMVPVMQFLQAIDFVDPSIMQMDDGRWHTRVFQRVDYEGGRRKFVYQDLYGATREEVLNKFNEAVGRGEGTKDQRTWADKMQGIREIYDKVLKDSDFEDNSMDFLMQTLDAQGLAEDFDDLLSRNKGVANMNHLSSKDLSLINNIIKNIFHSVNQGNKAYSQASVDIQNLAQSTIKEGSDKAIKTRSGIMEGIHKMLRLDNVTPRTFFKLLGSRGNEVYKFLRGGLNQEILDLKKASEFMTKAMEGIDAKKWTGTNATVHEFALSSGSVKMTDDQIMGLYFTIRRNGGMDRIKGGIVVDDIKTKANKIRRQNAIHLTEADIKQIESVLTPEQIEVGKKMQQYMASDCSAMGNETSMKMYGYKKFTDDTYYPWTVDKDTVPTSNTSENIPMFTGIERSGFTKQLKEGATNPLVIKGIFDVFTDHVAQMAAYHGYAAPVKDTLRWMNYREKSSGDGFDTWITTKKAINNLTGSERGVGYISTLLLDINKANKSQYIGNFTDRLIGNYKAAAVGANLRVVAQQPTAYFRALNQIDAKYLLTVNPATAMKNIKRSQEESPISWWKSKGYYETNLGQPIKEIVTGISTWQEKAKDLMMSPAGWADDFTWGFLYTAVEKEQRDKLRGQKLSAEEFRKAVNDRFDEVVDNTQVVDSTLHRSQYMRSNDRLNKLQTAFMAEPTKSYNMLLEAVLEDKNEGNTMKRTARATTAFILSALATSAAAAVVDAMRKARDDEDWWEVWLKNLKENVEDNLNPFNLLPVVKDLSAGIYNLITNTSTYGQSGNRFDIEAISSIMNAASAWQKMIEGESNKTTYGFIMANAKPISQITGIPAYNLIKDTVALYNSFFENIETTVQKGIPGKTERKKEFITDVEKERSDEVLDESIIDAVNNGVSIYDLKDAVQSEYKNDYFDAYAEGDMVKVTEIANKAARAYARMGLEDDKIDEIINEWQEEVITYSALDKAIAAGEGIEDEVRHVQEGKDDDKIIKHILSRYAETIAFEDTHNTESDWRGNVETALQTIDATIDYDTAQEEARQKQAEKDAKAAEDAEIKSMKNDFFDAVDRMDGAAGRKALDALSAKGKDAKTMKSAVSTQYHEAWKEATTQAEKNKAKKNWMSAYELVCNYYKVDHKDLNKTWEDWEADQNK